MSIEEDILIFDLDGTLFDSAPQILSCFKTVFDNNDIKIKNNINESIIGPPIKDTFLYLLHEKDHNKIDVLINDFKELYDNNFCHKTKLYDGVLETLNILFEHKILYLITNKRMIPTQKMLEFNGLDRLFAGFYSVDQNDNLKK